MNEHTAKEVGEIVGVGLATNYLKQAHGDQHPRANNGRTGGITPALQHTGDLKHDAAMEAGRLATNVGVAHWVLLPIWKIYAIATAIACGLLLSHAIPLAVVLWIGLQIGFLCFWGAVFDGRKDKSAVKKPGVPRTLEPGAYAPAYSGRWTPDTMSPVQPRTEQAVRVESEAHVMSDEEWHEYAASHPPSPGPSNPTTVVTIVQYQRW